MSDWPMPPHEGPGDEDCLTPDECGEMLLGKNPAAGGIAMGASCGHRPGSMPEARARGSACPPPPDVWEFYRRNGRWPEAGEA